MVEDMGYNVGSPLIQVSKHFQKFLLPLFIMHVLVLSLLWHVFPQTRTNKQKPAFDNEKGFYELLPVVLQNDIFMTQQKTFWGNYMASYHSTEVFGEYHKGGISFKSGQKALNFLNDNLNSPWLQKDPRMCITLSTWLSLLNNEPAVLFTFRHPLEVAKSLMKREKVTISKGLELWLCYNKLAVINSRNLCRVVSR